MTRARVIAAIRDFLIANYEGPVTILPETGTDILVPPYAVVRVGSAEQMCPGQVEIWDMNVLVAVFHDADKTLPETAEAQAAGVFAALDDPDPLFESSTETLAWSAFERLASEAAISETNWQHVAGFRAIVAPTD